MRVVVKLFAGLQAVAGVEHLELTLPGGSCVKDLRQAMGEECPALGPLLTSCVFALDTQYAPESAPLTGADEIACIPPVSGG